MIILVGSNKGGAGKTTTAITIATGLAAHNNSDVCLIDADKQSSSSRWSSDRECSDNELIHITCLQKYGNLQPTLNSLRNKYDHIVIDVSGRNSRELITGMLCADLLISPAQCSQLDLDTLSELQEQVLRAKDFNPNLSVCIYHVMSSTNPKVAPLNKKEFKEFVSEYGDFLLFDSFSCYRKIYRDVMPDGISVIEQNRDLKAKQEGLELIEEVLTYAN
jgi:chromosome partitioning protein